MPEAAVFHCHAGGEEEEGLGLRAVKCPVRILLAGGFTEAGDKTPCTVTTFGFSLINKTKSINQSLQYSDCVSKQTKDRKERDLP